MPKYRYGDMWKHQDEAALTIVTGNSYIKVNGALVMGRGAARHLRDMVPNIDMDFGRKIREGGGHLGVYGMYIAKGGKYGIAQVKRHFKDKADLELIQASMTELVSLVWVYQPSSVHMNYPGIGNGGLSVEEVQPYLECLPSTVVIWRYAKEK